MLQGVYSLILSTAESNKRYYCGILFSSFPLLLAFDVGGLGFEFSVFVAGWRHALRSEWLLLLLLLLRHCNSEVLVVTL